MAGYVYASERYADWKHEAAALLELHYDEIAADKDLIKLNPDHERYEYHDSIGQLNLVTCRKDGALVGYHIAFVYTHPHYRDSLTAFTDVFFIHPEHRNGRVGIRLFQYAEKTLREKCVQRIYTGTKLSNDIGSLLEYMDFKPIERLYTKVLR